jgi:hypothetical protein
VSLDYTKNRKKKRVSKCGVKILTKFYENPINKSNNKYNKYNSAETEKHSAETEKHSAETEKYSAETEKYTRLATLPKT